MGFASFDNTGFASLSPDLDSMVRGELAGDEKLVWVGQPLPGRMTMAAIPISIFGIFFTGFAIVWMVMALAIAGGGMVAVTGRPAFGLGGGVFALFGLPFLAVGLGMLTSPIWAGRRALRTCYALTDRRVIVWNPGWFGGVQVRSYRPQELGSITRNQRGDGSGDLIFREFTTFGPNGRRNVTRDGLMAVENVKEVEALIRSTLLHD